MTPPHPSPSPLQARLGLLEVHLRDCGASSGWARAGSSELELSNETKACVLGTPMGETIAALWKTRQGLAARRTPDERAAYAAGQRLISTCSEFMLRPGAGVWRSSRYASNMAVWQKAFPKEQIQVFATEEMERDMPGTMRAVFAFLGLAPHELPPMANPRLCSVGKASDAAESPTITAAWRAGRLDSTSDEGGSGGGAYGVCADRDSEESIVGKDGVSRYKIDGATEALLRRYFMPFNERLFALLGRRLPWGETV